MDLLRPLHLVTGSTQNVAHRRILGIGIKRATAKKHHLDKQANGPVIGKSIALGPFDRGTERHSQLLITNYFTKSRRKIFAVSRHLVLELLPSEVLKGSHLLGTNDHGSSC